MRYMYPAEKLRWTYPVTFRDDDGNVLTSISVQVVILPLRTVPEAATEGAEAAYTHLSQPDDKGFYGEVEVIVAGPDAIAPPANALVLGEWGGDLYVKPDENPELDWTFLERYEILR